MKVKFSEIIDFQKKSHIKAGDGLSEGSFPFFTSSPVLSKCLNVSQFDSPSLIFGTGGSASVHICVKPFSISTDCLVAQLKSCAIKKFDIKFIFYYLSGNISILENGFRGAGLKHISKGYINNIDIPEIPFEDQKRIVKILDKADALRLKRKQAIGLLDDYLKSVFLEMFGDPVKNSKNWKVNKLGEMIDFMTSGSRGWAKYYSETGDIFLRIQNVRNNTLKTDDLCFVLPPNTAEAKRTKVRGGDVLLSITADLGRTAVIPEDFGDAYISQHLALLRFKKEFIPDYIAEYLTSRGGMLQMSRLNKGGVKAGLNFNDIKSLEIPIPDARSQEIYLNRKKHVQELKNKMLAQSTELESQFQALVQKSFRSSIVTL